MTSSLHYFSRHCIDEDMKFQGEFQFIFSHTNFQQKRYEQMLQTNLLQKWFSQKNVPFLN